MKNLILFLFVFWISFFGFVQKHPHHSKGHNGHNKHHNHVKKAHPHHYYKKNRVVVKPRSFRPCGTLPIGYSTIVFRGKKHFYHNGHYYYHHANAYHFMPPPFGIRISVLPNGYHRVFFGTNPRFFYKGVYYKKIDNEYEVVEPEIGTIVPELPMDLIEEISINNETYYEYDNYLYKTKVTNDGVMYEVVGKLED
jgi:hypothetical protein